jgi:outer membrane protein assembly factor BamB
MSRDDPDRSGDTAGLNRRQFVLSTTGLALGGFGATTGVAGESTGQQPMDDDSIESQSTAPGEHLWSVETAAPITASPTVVDGTVYVGSERGTVFALDASTGETRWETAFDGRLESAPAVVGNTVFLGDTSGTVSALTASSGRLVWEFETDGAVLASPTVRDGDLVVGDESGTVWGIDAWTGNEDWQFDAGGAVWSSATLVGGTAYVGANTNRVYAIDTDDGTERWRAPTDGTVDSAPTVADETVFVGSVDNRVYALDAATGDQLWTTETDDWVTAAPTAAGGQVVAGSEDNRVYALDPATGQRAWTVTTDWAVTGSPTLAGGMAFVGSDDHSLYAIDATAGTVSWEFQTGGRIEAAPIVVDGVVFVASTDGSIAALDAGVDGSSDGSRVSLGTLGHHHGWATAAAGDATTLTVDNENTTAWTVSAIDGEGAITTDGRNPTLKLRPGTRYTIENGGWDTHPFALVDKNGNRLVSQSGDGSFDDDPDVNAVSEQAMLSFTMTAPLADAVSRYVCTVHTQSMRGPVTILRQPDPLPGQTAPPQDLNGDGWYRDLDGDGSLSVTDLQLYFDQVYRRRNTEYVTRNRALFDYDGSGQITLDDLHLLYSAVLESDPDAPEKLGIDAEATDSPEFVDLEAILGGDTALDSDDSRQDSGDDDSRQNSSNDETHVDG